MTSSNSLTITKTDNYKAIQQYGESPEVIKVFSSMMGSQGIQFIQSAIMAVRANDTLMMCEPKSIFLSALRAATLGLSCDPVLGHAFLIPYRNNQVGGYVATFQAGYKGIMNLATRTGKYRYINVSDIWNGEEIIEDRITGELTITGEALSPKTPIGMIASFALFSGLKKSVYMTNEELEAHGRTYSKSYNDARSLWRSNKPAMYRKTILLRLLRTWGYLSPEHSAILSDSDGENMASLELPSEAEVTVPATIVGIKFVDPDPEDNSDSGMQLIERAQARILPTEEEPEYPEIIDDADSGAKAAETPKLPTTLEEACAVTNSEGEAYGKIDRDKLSMMRLGIKKGIKKEGITEEQKAEYEKKLDAIAVILAAKADGSIN